LPPRDPIVSVVMAVRDGAAFVSEAVESVLGQTFDDFELIVVDDGSTDRTPEILAALASRDGRIRLLRQEGGGVSRARNLGCAEARGRFLAILDADDVAMPRRLELQVPALESQPDLAVVGGAVAFVDERGVEFGAATYPSAPADVAAVLGSGRVPVMQSAATIRAEAFRRTSGYRPVMTVAQDYDLWLRIVEHGRIANLPETVVRYRFHPGQASTRDLERTAIAVRVALAASRRREAGGGDPLDAAESLDRDLAQSLGIGSEEIAEQQIDYGLWLARTLTRGGYGAAVAPLWRACLARAGDSRDPRRRRIAILRARADSSGAGRGEAVRALALRAAAGALEPRRSAALLRSRLFRRGAS
jgi:glycosyltransferase involved in cell wall biosynthesis